MNRHERRAKSKYQRKYAGSEAKMTLRVGEYPSMLATPQGVDAAELLITCIRAGSKIPDGILTDEELFDATAELIESGFADIFMDFRTDGVNVKVNLKNKYGAVVSSTTTEVGRFMTEH